MKIDRIIQSFIFALLVISIIICGVYIYMSYTALNTDAGSNVDDGRLESMRSKSILITGTSENEDYLNQIYEGAL